MVVKTKMSAPESEPKKPGNIYDAFAKQMLGRLFVFTDFLINYADKHFVDEIDLTQIQQAPTHYFGKDGTERISDLVFACPLKDNNKKKSDGKNEGGLMAVIVFEHQSKNLKDIPHKLLKIVSAIWEGEKKDGKKTLSAPYFLVLRTGKKPLRGTPPKLSASLPKGRDGKPVGKTVEVEYDLVDLPAWDFSKLVGGTVLRLTLGILHKMTGGNLDELPAALRPLMEIADPEQRIDLAKDVIPFAAKVFAAKNRRLDEAQIDEILKPIFKGKERAMIKTIFEEKYDAGVAAGETKWKAEGKAETLLKILRERFNRIPKETEKRISQMTDPIALDSWAIQAATCQSMDEFVEAFRR